MKDEDDDDDADVTHLIPAKQIQVVCLASLAERCATQSSAIESPIEMPPKLPHFFSLLSKMSTLSLSAHPPGNIN